MVITFGKSIPLAIYNRIKRYLSIVVILDYVGSSAVDTIEDGTSDINAGFPEKESYSLDSLISLNKMQDL